MNPSNHNCEYLQAFVVADTNKVTQKLRRFMSAGPAKIHFLFDFDRTLTTSKHTGDNTTTWQILHGLLPAHGQKASDTIRDKYLALEAAGALSPEDSHAFSTSVLSLHTTHGTHRLDIERAAKQIKLRDGSRELFAACEAAGIPTIILSAGIRDIIELIAHSNGINPSLLISLKLLFDENGRLNGWDKDSMVLIHNKQESFRQWAADIHEERPYTVLIGDTVEDARMAEGDENVLRIRVCDSSNDACGSTAYHEETFNAGFDLIVDEDLVPIANLTKALAQAA